MIIRALREKSSKWFPNFRLPQRKHLAVEDEGVKPTGWALETPVGEPPNVPTLPVCPPVDSGTGGRSGPHRCHACQLPLVLPHFLSSRAPECLWVFQTANSPVCWSAHSPGLSTAISLEFLTKLSIHVHSHHLVCGPSACPAPLHAAPLGSELSGALGQSVKSQERLEAS